MEIDISGEAGADSVDVRFGRQQGVESAWLELAPLDQFQVCGMRSAGRIRWTEDLLYLRAAVQPNQSPRHVVMDRRDRCR
jgi:hypothetical protein